MTKNINKIIKNTKNIKKLPIHPSFLLLFLWFIFSGRWIEFFIFVFVVLTHEIGHYFVAKKLGYKLDSFFVAPYGVSLNYKNCVFENNDEIKIALAGPMVNFILAFFVMALWWIFPEVYCFSEVFVFQSLNLALFNLLPAYPFDGGRILLAFLSKIITRQKALKITKILNYIFAAIFFVLFGVSCAVNFNPTFALAGIFMIVGSIESKYESSYKILSLFKKKNKQFSRPFLLSASSSASLAQMLKHIQPNRYTVFFIEFENGTKVLDEKLILDLSLSFPLELTLEQIFQKKHV